MIHSCSQKNTRQGLSHLLVILLTVLITLITLSPVTIHTALATDVTLQWDSNSEPDIAGYKVYYGTESGNYTTTLDVGNFTSCVISELDPEQIYFFAATAYNIDGYESDYSNEVSYTDASTDTTNEPPVADAGPMQAVSEGSVVTLSGVNSSDPDDGIASYAWTLINGPYVELSGATTPQATFTAPEVETDGMSITFALTVTDYSGQSSTDTCIVNITALNDPPIADAGADQTVSAGAAVILNGSNSTDPDDGIASYLWTQTGGPAVTLSSTAAVSPAFTSPDVTQNGATLSFLLTVTDNGGLQSTDTCIVNVTWSNEPPVANAGSDQSVMEGVSVTLDGSNSTDPDDGIASYLWTQTSGPAVNISNPTAAQPTFTAPNIDALAAGTALAFQLTVTDNGGLQSTDTCIVNVTALNDPPTADAGTDQTVSEGSTVTLNGSNSTDPDDGIASYLWTQTSGPTVNLASSTSAQPTFTAPDVDTNGATLVFQLTVTDGMGLQSTDTCAVNVVNVTSSNIPPVAEAGANQTVYEGSTVRLDATNSYDHDGSIVSYQWKQIRGITVTLSNSMVATPTFKAPNVNWKGDLLTFELTVTDDNGLQSTDTCTVAVRDAWIKIWKRK